MDGKKVYAVRQIVRSMDDIDYQANAFCELMTGGAAQPRASDEGIAFSRAGENSLDLVGIAHHKKVFAKFSHRIDRHDTGSILFGRYKFFLFVEDRVEPVLLEEAPFCEFDFDAEGTVEQNNNLSTSANGPYSSVSRSGFIAMILASLHDRLAT
jgi:hypothetical protein